MTALPDSDSDTLDRLRPGEHATVLRLSGHPGVRRRLMELGLVPGTAVQLIRRAPLGDPIELAVRGVHMSIRRSEASLIHVAR